MVCPNRVPLRGKRPTLSTTSGLFRKDELNQSFPLDGFARNISRVLPCESKKHLFKTKPDFFSGNVKLINLNDESHK